jgi:hypothetical protein
MVGNTTDLTVGRYSGLEAYLSDDLGVESIELAIYNYDKRSGPFSTKGDSGERREHPRHLCHPAWWVIEESGMSLAS